MFIAALWKLNWSCWLPLKWIYWVNGNTRVFLNGESFLAFCFGGCFCLVGFGFFRVLVLFV